MKKVSLTISTILFSLFLIIPSLSVAHDDAHDKSSDHGKDKQYEEGSGSSAVDPSHEGKEYKSDHHEEAEEAEEEGSFSYKRHRKEMKEKKAIVEDHKKEEEGSGSR